jgi:hypothetical protein
MLIISSGYNQWQETTDEGLDLAITDPLGEFVLENVSWLSNNAPTLCYDYQAR